MELSWIGSVIACIPYCQPWLQIGSFAVTWALAPFLLALVPMSYILPNPEVNTRLGSKLIQQQETQAWASSKESVSN